MKEVKRVEKDKRIRRQEERSRGGREGGERVKETEGV